MAILSFARIHAKILLKRCLKKEFLCSTRTVKLACQLYKDLSLKKTPIIVLHGFLGSKRNIQSFLDKLGRSIENTLIAADARNHGESPHTETHSYGDLAGDVKELMATLEIREAILLGHSMGARTAMTLALMEPDIVKALILLDISPVSTPWKTNSFFPNILNAMSKVKFAPLMDLCKARQQARDVLAKEDIGAGTRELLLMNIGVRDGKVGWNVNVDTLKKEFYKISSFPQELLKKSYCGSTLFVGGGQSNYLPSSDLPEIRKIFPKAEYHVIKSAGHNVHADAPDALKNLVVHFLKKV